jgi:glycosyltransferase involved in cell wall biosynthesis
LGTPVLSSNVSSIPEVAGDAAMLVDPYSGRALRNGIVALDTIDQNRDRMAQQGRNRTKFFATHNIQDVY